MLAASVSDQYRPHLDSMARAAVGRATVNGVLVVEAPAVRVELNQLVAHLEYLPSGSDHTRA